MTIQLVPRRRIRNVLRALLVAMAVLVLGLAAGGVWGLRSLNQALNDELYLEQRVIDQAYNLRVAAEREAVGARGFLLAGDPTSMANWERGRADFARALATLRQADLPPADRRELDELAAIQARWVRLQEGYIAQKRKGQLERVIPSLREEAMPLREQVTSRLDAFIAGHQRQVAALHDQVTRRGDLVSGLMVLAALLAVPLLAALALVAKVRLFAPLRDLERAAMRFGDGDLEARAHQAQDDELGAVALAFNAMAGRITEAITTIQENERRFRTVVDALQEGVMLQQRDQAVSVFNPAAERILGLTSAQLAGREPLPTGWHMIAPGGEVLGPDDLPLAHSLLTGEPRSGFEAGVVRPGYPVTWLSMAAVPLFRPGDARPYAAVGSVFDLTERKQAEQQARLVQLLVSSVTDYGIYLLDPSGHVTTWNKGAEALKGYREDEALGRHFSHFFSADDVAAGKPERLMALALAHGHVEDEGWRIRKDGTRFWANAVLTALRDDHGKLAGFAKVTRDLTERKRAEEALASQAAELERQRKLLASILAHVPTAIAFLDRDLVYRWNNPAHCELAGCSQRDVIGHTVGEVFPAMAAAVDELYREVFATREPQFKQGLVIPIVRDGREVARTYDVAYVPVTAEGQVEGVLVVASEVSERVAREQAQQQLIDSLRAIDKLKDEFLAVLSHELRTPINAIMGFGSVLEDGLAGPLTEQQRAYMGKILKGADALLALVDDLLDMGRIRAGKLVLEREAVDLREVVAHVVAGTALAAERKRQRITVALPPDLPAIWADGKRVGQVVANLVNNALKFTPEGGEVVVRAAVAGDRVRCEVQDTGIGIAAADFPRLFKQFTQLDSGNTRRAGGIGLGLSISKALIEAHGGEIGAESAGEGHGATFWFTVPVAGPGTRPA